MNERNDTFENELTEENLPDPKQRDDTAHTLKEDPGVDSQQDDATMADNDFGLDEAKPQREGG